MQFKTYTYETFWSEKGLQPAEPFSEEKQQFILNKLKQLDFKSVLEFGVGNGELSKIILKNFDCYFEGFDISEARVYQFDENMQYNNIPYHKYKIFECDFRNYKPLRDEYDLIICSHFLLHIRPNHINQAIKMLLDYSTKYVVFFEPCFVDKVQDWQYYNFEYDYIKYFQELKYKAEFTRFDEFTGIFVVRKD